MKYAHLEKATNKLLGWYDSDINSNIPTPNIKVSVSAWQDALDNNYNHYNDVSESFDLVDFRTKKDILSGCLYQLATIRNEKRNSGVKFKNKIIYTDKSSINDITASILAATVNNSADLDVIEPVWKCKDGVLTDLTFADVKEIGRLAKVLIQKSYIAESLVITKVNKLNNKSLNMFNPIIAFDLAFKAII